MANLQRYRMFIDGQWIDAGDGRTFTSFNPATGDDWAEIPEATAADVDRAVTAAHRAFSEGEWAKALPSARGTAGGLHLCAPRLHIARLHPQASDRSAQVSCGYAGADVRPAQYRVAPASRQGCSNARRGHPRQCRARYSPAERQGPGRRRGPVFRYHRVMRPSRQPSSRRPRPPHESNSDTDRSHDADASLRYQAQSPRSRHRPFSGLGRIRVPRCQGSQMRPRPLPRLAMLSR